MKHTKKEWESRFFERPIWALQLEERVYSYADLESLQSELESFQRGAPEGLYELELNARFLFLSPVFEAAGFRLCDSKFRFLTKVDRQALPKYKYDLPEDCAIRPYEPADLPEVLALNERWTVGGSQLVSKWKSSYFHEEAASQWFGTWIRNSLSQGAHCSILFDEDRVRGFFIYQRSDQEHRGLPCFKGILSAIDPEFRGRNLHLALQEYIFQTLIAEPVFYIDNTTQISNTPIFRNHFHSRRTPQSISLIFFWQKGNPPSE